MGLSIIMAKLESSLILSLIDHVTAPARGVAAAVRGLQDRLDANNRQMDAMRGRMLDAAAAGYGLVQAIRAPVQAAMDFESAMADVKKVVDFPTPQAFLDFQNALVEMSKSVPVSVIGLSEIAAAAGQAGIAGADLIRFTEAAAKIGVAFDISADQAGDAMAKLMTNLGITIDQAMLLADSMNHLSNAQASGADEILSFVMGTASMAKGFNLSATQAAAFGSAMISAGAQVDVAKTSFQNMGAVLVAGAAASSAQKSAFAALGLSATKVAAAMQVDAEGTIIDVLERINGLPAEVRQGTIFQLFGKNADAILPLITNLDLLRESLALVESEGLYAGSSFKEFEVRAGTFANAVTTFNNRLTALKIVIGAALIPALNALMERLEPLIETITQLATANPMLTASIVGVAGALIALRVASLAAGYSMLWIKGGALTAAALGMSTIGLAAKAAAIPLIALAVGFGRARTAAMAFLFAASIAGKGQALSMVGASLLGLLNPLRLVTASFGLLKVALISSGVGAALVAVGTAGALIANNWSGIQAMFEAFGQAFMTAIQPIQPMLQPVIDLVGQLAGAFGLVTAEIDPSHWSAWGTAAGVAIGTLLTKVVALPGQIVAAFTSIFDQMRDAGGRIIQSLWDGIAAKWTEFMNWLNSLPSQIGNAFAGVPGQIGALFGMGGPAPAAAPGVDGAKAAGGPITAGKTYLVGEEGPELVTPSRSGWVNTASQTRGMLGGQASGGRLISLSFGNIILQNPVSASPAEIAAAFGRELEDRISGMQADMEWGVA